MFRLEFECRMNMTQIFLTPIFLLPGTTTRIINKEETRTYIRFPKSPPTPMLSNVISISISISLISTLPSFVLFYICNPQPLCVEKVIYEKNLLIFCSLAIVYLSKILWESCRPEPGKVQSIITIILLLLYSIFYYRQYTIIVKTIKS